MNDDSLYEKNCDEEGISRIREKVDNIEKYLIKLTKNIEENMTQNNLKLSDIMYEIRNLRNKE